MIVHKSALNFMTIYPIPVETFNPNTRCELISGTEEKSRDTTSYANAHGRGTFLDK